MNVDKSMQCEWVIGSYTGDHAKAVKALADAGVAYFFRNAAGMGPHYTVAVAFRRAKDSMLPAHLELANAQQIATLDRMYASRHGEKRPDRRPVPVESMLHIGRLQGMSQAVPSGDQ